MEVVVGLTLKSLKPDVWTPDSEYYLKQVEAVMVSYADFDRNRTARQEAMEKGLHAYLGLPEGISVYLDNGAFSLMKKDREVPREEYEEFIEQARPHWYPIPRDYIPAPSMSEKEQLEQMIQTMAMNGAYDHDGFVPVLHVSRVLREYVERFQNNEKLLAKNGLAIGGIVPNLLRAPKALNYKTVLNGLQHVREIFDQKAIHLFGVGGTSTLHIAALLGIDSVDSTGWRNRAARGIIQLPGSGDRSVADLGSWKGRKLSKREWDTLENCGCPACKQHGLHGLTANKIFGFCNRATHNLWVLLEEARQIEYHLQEETYEIWYENHLKNSIYKPLIEYLLKKMRKAR